MNHTADSHASTTTLNLNHADVSPPSTPPPPSHSYAQIPSIPRPSGDRPSPPPLQIPSLPTQRGYKSFIPVNPQPPRSPTLVSHPLSDPHKQLRTLLALITLLLVTIIALLIPLLVYQVKTWHFMTADAGLSKNIQPSSLPDAIALMLDNQTAHLDNRISSYEDRFVGNLQSMGTLLSDMNNSIESLEANSVSSLKATATATPIESVIPTTSVIPTAVSMSIANSMSTVSPAPAPPATSSP